MKQDAVMPEKTLKKTVAENNRLEGIVTESTAGNAPAKATAPVNRLQNSGTGTPLEATNKEITELSSTAPTIEDSAKVKKAALSSPGSEANPEFLSACRSQEMNSFIGKLIELQVRKKHIVRSAAIISNKGGVGKTHIASNMSFYMSRLGRKVLLIDLDLGNSDITNKLGFYCKNTIMDLFNGREDVDQLIYNTPYGFDLVAGESGDFRLANLTSAHKNRFIRALRKVSGEYDFVLYDLSAGIASTTIDFALAQDYQIIITTPQDIIAGYSCIKAAFYRFQEVEKILAQRDHTYQMRTVFRPFIILNQVPDFSVGRALFDKIAHVSKENIRADRSFSLELNLLGVISADPEKIRESELKHFMYSNSYGASKTGQCFHFLSHNLIQYKDPNNMEFQTRFQRFVDLFMKGVEEFKYAQ